METEEQTDEENSTTHVAQETTQSRLHLTRAAMNGLKPLTAGALSAISIVTEAREMKNVVDKIRAGNPCEKAERLAGIKIDVDKLPKTEVLSSQLGKFVSRQETKAAAVEDEKDLVPSTSSDDSLASIDIGERS